MSYKNIVKKNLYTQESCINVVSSDGMKLRDVIRPTEAICVAAVSNNAKALEFCQILTPRIIQTALQKDKNAMRIVSKRTDFWAWKIAVDMYPELLFESPVLDERLCQSAVQQNPSLFLRLQHVTFSETLFLGIFESRSWLLSSREEQVAFIKQLEPKFWNLLISSKPVYFPLTPQTPENCLTAVRYDGYFLEIVENKTPEICLEAVKNRYGALRYVSELTPELFIAALEKSISVSKFHGAYAFQGICRLKKPSKEIVLACMDRFPEIICQVFEDNPEIVLECIHRCPRSVMYLPPGAITSEIATVVFNNSPDSPMLQELAVIHKPSLFPKMKAKSEDVFLRILSKSKAWYKLSDMLKYRIMKQLDVSYSAILIKRDPTSFDYIRQSEEICLIAVKHKWTNIKYVKDKTPKVCIEAALRDARSLQWIPEPTTEVYAAAIKSLCLYSWITDASIHRQIYGLPREQLLEVLRLNPSGIRFLEDKEVLLQLCRENYKLCHFADKKILSEEILREIASQGEEAKMYLVSRGLIGMDTFAEAEKFIRGISSEVPPSGLLWFVRYVVKNLTPLPEGIVASELQDPISFLEPEAGEIGAFYMGSNGVEYFALMTDSIIALQKAGYVCPDNTTSSYEMVLVPGLNKSVHIKDLKWHRF